MQASLNTGSPLKVVTIGGGSDHFALLPVTTAQATLVFEHHDQVMDG